jgi:Flp pilus assembly pilin Flp
MAIRPALIALMADRRGATAIEYALIAAIVGIIAISGLQAVGSRMDYVWNVLIAALAEALA